MRDPELVQVFRLAQLELQRRHFVYICNALDAVGYSSRKLEAAAKRAKQLVRARMYLPGVGHTPLSLEYWLHAQRPRPKGLPDFRTISFHSRAFRAQMRAYRIQWLDHLIKEFS